MQRKKCQWFSLLCLAILFPLNVICFWVSIVLSFFDPRKKEFFNFNKNCGFHDHVLITATFSSIPLHHFSFSEFLSSCLWFFIFSTKIKRQSSATTHFEDDFKRSNHIEKFVEYIGPSIKSCPIKLKTKCKKKWRWSCRLMKTWHTYNNNIVNLFAKKLIQNLHSNSTYGIFYV